MVILERGLDLFLDVGTAAQEGKWYPKGEAADSQDSRTPLLLALSSLHSIPYLAFLS